MIQSGMEFVAPSNSKSKDCTICNNKNSSYKCPKCNDRYCCSACYQQHKAKCFLNKKNDVIIEDDKSNNDDKLISVSNNSAPTIENSNIPSLESYNNDSIAIGNEIIATGNDMVTNTKGSESLGILSNITDKDVTTLFAQDSQLLHEDMKRKLCSSKELISRLKSKRLRKDIVAIDSSQDRSSALKNTRQNNKEFDQFLTSIVNIINS